MLLPWMVFFENQLLRGTLLHGMGRALMKSVIESWDDCLRELDKAAEDIAKLRELFKKVGCSAKEAEESLKEIKEKSQNASI